MASQPANPELVKFNAKMTATMDYTPVVTLPQQGRPAHRRAIGHVRKIWAGSKFLAQEVVQLGSQGVPVHMWFVWRPSEGGYVAHGIGVPRGLNRPVVWQVPLRVSDHAMDRMMQRPVRSSTEALLEVQYVPMLCTQHVPTLVEESKSPIIGAERVRSKGDLYIRTNTGVAFCDAYLNEPYRVVVRTWVPYSMLNLDQVAAFDGKPMLLDRNGNHRLGMKEQPEGEAT